nr:hypothetical protein [Tanacetum cinerariifolium]
MSNTNNTLQTQTSNALHSAIMESGGKDRPTIPPHEFQLINPTAKVAEDGTEITTAGHMEAYHNVSKEIRDQHDTEAKTIQIILTGIDNDIYSTVDACPNACEMWKEIKRKFTSQDGESLESYYSRFYKMMNELVRNKCDIYNHQVNVQFLLQLQQEWQRFVTLVKQNQELKEKHKKEIYKLMALISLSFKKIYKPANNNLRTSSNTNRANHDNSLRTNRGTGYNNQRAVNVARSRETIGTQVVQQSGIQCYNCKEFRLVVRECQKLKWEKDLAYHKEKMLLCKQEEARIQLSAKQVDWRDDSDDEPQNQELEAHYLYMAKIQKVSPDADANSGPIFDAEPLKKVQYDDNYNVFANDRQHPEQPKSVNDTFGGT